MIGEHEVRNPEVQMEYEVQEVPSLPRGLIVSIVRISGELRCGPGESLIDAVQPLIDRPNARVVLELSGVTFVSSAGLGELVRITAQANSQSARVLLASLSPFVAGVLETTKLSRFFEIAADVDSAVRKLTS